MSLTDYQDRITRLQKSLGQAFSEEPFIVNIPGKSIIFKIDPYYYAALEPAFTNGLSKWSAMHRDSIRETLVRTGNVVTSPGNLNPIIKIQLGWNSKFYKLNVCFIEASFIDHALKIYGGVPGDIGMSDLVIASTQRDTVDSFFGERTRLQSIAFANQPG
ncbi:hypothetical protein [Maridesulfovibrio bastinii]|uniref:hypothetical protein n=1 Tax=Maridesulfovibrio bastinii TaxID=47157 RepID=UPI000417124F|nr:hypothetical protein [Maridesulfovibrio bastinii]